MNKRSFFSPLKTLLIVVCLIWGAGVLTGTYFARRQEEPRALTAPLVLQIQRLGQLHTVRYNVHDVYEHERAIRPKGWLSSIPGVDGLCKAATNNQVTVEANGGVEAGVDLSGLTPEDVTRVVTPQGTRVRVHLPRPILYTPDVKVHVIDRKPGIFWNDADIVPDATETVHARIVAAAEKSDILSAAERNAVSVLTNMQRAAGNPDVEFYF